MKKKTPKNRCSHCRMDVDLCLCAFIKPVVTQTHIELLIHGKEFVKPSNTGHLAGKLLSSCRITVRNSKKDSRIWQEELFSQVNSVFANIFFLCHDPEAMLLEDALRAAKSKGGSNILALVDGTWNQAQQIVERELGELTPFKVRFSKQVSDPIGNLWQEPLPGGLATLEAVWRALEIMEPESSFGPIHEFLTLRSHRIKWIRGLMSETEVLGGIPVAAINKKNIAG